MTRTLVEQIALANARAMREQAERSAESLAHLATMLRKWATECEARPMSPSDLRYLALTLDSHAQGLTDASAGLVTEHVD